MNSITAKADYSEAAGHVLDVVHEVQIKRYYGYVQPSYSCALQSTSVIQKFQF